jgi:hypothetical protein
MKKLLSSFSKNDDIVTGFVRTKGVMVYAAIVKGHLRIILELCWEDKMN